MHFYHLRYKCNHIDDFCIHKKPCDNYNYSFNKSKIEFPVFDCDMKCNIDWNAWEKLSLKKGSFSFINKHLMGHKISEETTTTEIINSGIRTKEDYEIYIRFWPKWFAKKITKLYKNSEKNNNVK